MPASCKALSKSFPAGPTNGFPARSSSFPGCSPTKTTVAFGRPSPKTVCVPVFHNGQALQFLAAARRVANVGREGIKSRLLNPDSVEGFTGFILKIFSMQLCLHGNI